MPLRRFAGLCCWQIAGEFHELYVVDLVDVCQRVQDIGAGLKNFSGLKLAEVGIRHLLVAQLLDLSQRHLAIEPDGCQVLT